MANNVGPPISIPDFTLEDWWPMEPAKGPPLPLFLNIYWPWYKPPIPPAPPGKANLQGKVTDSETGNPLEGVLLELNGLSAHTDSDGNYAFLDLETGTYEGSASKEGYETAYF